MSLTTKCALYCRVSTEEQAKEGFSIPSQKKILTEYCKLKGWDIAKIYTDEGLSGKSMKRPAFQEMLGDAARGLFQVILVWKINRFSRKNSDLLNTSEYLKKFNVNLISYSEQFDASTPSGKLMLSMLGSIGEFERDTIVENIRAGMTERAERGLFNGGCVLGYDVLNGKLLINEDESKTVKEIFKLYLSGCGYNIIKSVLNSKNIKTKNGYKFEINSIKRILKNPIYAGYITYNKTKKTSLNVVKCENYIIVPGSHQPIITKEDFDRVQQIIASKSLSYTKGNSFILSQILKCPVCGGKMTGHNGRKKGSSFHYRYYICLNYKKWGSCVCSSNCVNADAVENEIINYLCSFVQKKDTIKAIFDKIITIHKHRNTDLDNEAIMLKKALSNKKRLLEKYKSLFENDSIDSSMFKLRIKDVENEILVTNERLNSIVSISSKWNSNISYDSINNYTVNFKTIFESLDNTTKKILFSLFIKEIHLTQSKEIENIELTFNVFEK